MGFCSGLSSAGKMVSMSVEIFFQCGSQTFLFVFWVLFMVLYGVFGSVWAGFVVRFCMVCGAF